VLFFFRSAVRVTADQPQAGKTADATA
jgi:hypothetical protein